MENKQFDKYITKKNEKPRFSVAIKSDAYQKLINDTLGDKEVSRKFVAEISSVVSNNYQLASCDAGSILSAGLLAQSINLPLAPSLGFCYIVPYKDKGQFQVGYKGLIQLSQRSGQFERLGVREVHEGEYAGQDEFGDDLFNFSHKFDNNKVVGYYAYFKLLNGFKKTMYMTVEQTKKHAQKYSKSFKATGDTNLWRDNFDWMSCKTVLKLLLNRYAPMSVDMQKAIQADQAIINQDGSYSYVDNEPELTKPTSRKTMKNSLADDTENVEKVAQNDDYYEELPFDFNEEEDEQN